MQRTLPTLPPCSYTFQMDITPVQDAEGPKILFWHLLACLVKDAFHGGESELLTGLPESKPWADIIPKAETKKTRQLVELLQKHEIIQGEIGETVSTQVEAGQPMTKDKQTEEMSADYAGDALASSIIANGLKNAIDRKRARRLEEQRNRTMLAAAPSSAPPPPAVLPPPMSRQPSHTYINRIKSRMRLPGMPQSGAPTAIQQGSQQGSVPLLHLIWCGGKRKC